MSCGYACIGCGRCRGKPRELNITSTCFRCGHTNPQGAVKCEQCGLEMSRLPGPSSKEPRTPSTNGSQGDSQCGKAGTLPPV